MSQKYDYKLDPRTSAEILAQIKKLSTSYTPEWAFSTSNPDAGSVIGLIFASQMADNIKKINQVIDKYNTEFVNMLNISLLSAYPASGVVVMELIVDTIPGIDVPKGTKLLGTAQSDDAEQIIFETDSDVHITGSRLCDIISVSGHFGKIIPIKGGVTRRDFVPMQNQAQATIDDALNEELSEILLFDYQRDGIEQHGLMLYHRSMFDTADNVDISVRMTEHETGADLAERFSDTLRYRWSYYSGEGLKPFDSVKCNNGAVVLSKAGENKRVQLDGFEYSMIYLEALSPVLEAVTLSSLRLSSSCEKTTPVFVVCNDVDTEPAAFMPFGETVSLFDECYVGHDQIFSQQGAMVTLKFMLSVHEKLVSVTQQQEIDDLKVIKRKPHSVQFHTASTSPQKVSFEYFNGTGWQRLVCTKDWSIIFDGNFAGDISVSFICPDDWQPTISGGYNGRALRMRVSQADNCYLMPCIHKMPKIEALTLSYSYYDNWKTPQRLRCICGTEISDLSSALLSGRQFTAFSPLPYTGNALYLGFDRKMEGSPVSILFNIEESVYFVNSPISFEYSTRAGFQRLKVIDHTDNMSGVGTVLFIPPSDFAKTVVEGQSRYWIRLVDESGAFDNPDRYHAVIRSIIPNAVEIRNVETMPEEAFYIDATAPNMSFPIAAENILNTEVFVNERNRHSLSAMRRMITEQPESVRVEYNFLGDISEFFVRWTEVDNFDASAPSDRHYLIDRMTSTIHFGDGVSVMIPGAQPGVAFTVQAVCCNGVKGNLPKGAVNSTFGKLLYIDSIYNPIATYAGSNIESIESAHLRGANMLNSKNRLVSELDFVREVKAFSTSVSKVKCVVGRDIDGTVNDRIVSLAVMMKDFQEGAYSFNSLKGRLVERLLKRCEATVTKEMISVTEPIYVEISVDVWAEVHSMNNSFMLQSLIKDSISAFIDPISGGSRAGWEIGTLPNESQIRMMLQSIKCDAYLSKHIITVRYVDRSGVHENDLQALTYNPFMIGVNGRHTVHMQLV